MTRSYPLDNYDRFLTSAAAKPPTPHPPTKPPPPAHHLALLVTTPPIHTYGPVSDRLYTTTPDLPAPIRWSSTDTTPRSIPPLLPTSLAFRRHFALCLVPEMVWKSGRMTVKEKLERGLFWDHGGGSVESSGGVEWEGSRVRGVNGVQVLGRVEGGVGRCHQGECSVDGEGVCGGGKR